MEIKLASRSCTDEQGSPHTFHYYLTIELVKSAHFFFECYGVRIEDEQGESACAPSLTTSAYEMDELIALLMGHTVSPVGLADVVSDWKLRTGVPT